MLLRTKDFFTVATIVLGFLVLPFGLLGKLEVASILILAGWFTDALDGIYARLTKTGNKFGAEFDTISDLIIFSLAPAMLLFFALKETQFWLAAGIAVLPLLFGCIRLARFNVKRIEYPGFWIGLPRPGLALLVVGYVNTVLFGMASIWATGVFVLILGIMNVTLIPYPGHHKRKFSTGQKTFGVLLLLAIVVSGVLGYFWEAVFGVAVIYWISPLFTPRKERKKLTAFIRKWRKEEATEK